MNYLRNILMLTLFAFFCVGELAARSYFLPDYQNKTYKSRTYKGPVKEVLKPECTNFPNTYSAVQSGKKCRSSSPYPGLNCYYCLGCSSEYYEECPAGYIRYENDICTDDGVTKYKCVEDPCADFVSKDECDNAGGYCSVPSKEECKSSYCDCIDYCQGMKEYDKRVIDNCENGCAAGQEVEGCEGLCWECKVEEPSCSNNEDGNFVDASGLTSLWDDTNFKVSPYNSECAALGYIEPTCDNGYLAVGCPFNTTATAGHFYHCVYKDEIPTSCPTNYYETQPSCPAHQIPYAEEIDGITCYTCACEYPDQSACEDLGCNSVDENECWYLKTCPDGYSTNVTSSDCAIWETYITAGELNGVACGMCGCTWSDIDSCNADNKDTTGIEATECSEIDGVKGCYWPGCEEGYMSYISPGQDLEGAADSCAMDGGYFVTSEYSEYCGKCVSCPGGYSLCDDLECPVIEGYNDEPIPHPEFTKCCRCIECDVVDVCDNTDEYGECIGEYQQTTICE